MFYLLIPIWLNNFHSDALLHQNDPHGLEFGGASKNYSASGRMPLNSSGCMDGFDGGGGGQQVCLSGFIEGSRLNAGGPMMMAGPPGSTVYVSGGGMYGP
jgi:hypothetical protein